MAERIIVWSKNAEIQLYQILDFFKNRNKSNTYSKKLYQTINKNLEKVLLNPQIGIKTKLTNIRGMIVENYIVYYEIRTDEILVLKIWDSRQDPGKLSFK